LTGAQEEIIGNLLEEKAFVLQGPPGTGKSHTLGFAVLACTRINLSRNRSICEMLRFLDDDEQNITLIFLVSFLLSQPAASPLSRHSTSREC
jgi:predicted NACHT family NTPase